MNKKKWKVGLAAAVAMTAFCGNAQQINPMTATVLQGYAEILEENPNDYMTLYDRASMYYDMGEYVRALSDIDMALECTPEKDSEYRMAELSLKSDILTTQKEYAKAIEVVNAALQINPVSQADLYKAGNLYLLTSQPQEALNAFQRLQRENPRSQEAFYGMAKANVMLGNNDAASDLIKEVENMGKQSFITYCRIGDLYSDMGRVNDAVTNYVIAYTMTDDNQRPIESLKFLARKNPKAVLESLESVIASSKDNVALQYVKAILAYDSGLYEQAEQACLDLNANLEEESSAVYRMLAMSQHAQNKNDKAKESIKIAERLAPENPGMLADKAEIYLSEEPSVAYEAAKKALVGNEDNPVYLTLAAKSAIMAEDYPQALIYLNDIVLSNPGNAAALLLRGYLNMEFLKDDKAGIADYTRASNITPGEETSDLILAALGKSKTGKKLDADGMIKDAIAKAGDDKNALYLIAVYYAQTGNLEKAHEFVNKAVANGYSNQYNLRSNKEPLFNLQPIKHLMK